MNVLVSEPRKQDEIKNKDFEKIQMQISENVPPIDKIVKINNTKIPITKPPTTKAKDWFSVQAERIKRVKDGCKSVSDPGYTSLNKLLTDNVGFKGKLLNNFIVDDKHKVLYCYVPKASFNNAKSFNSFFYSFCLISNFSTFEYKILYICLRL